MRWRFANCPTPHSAHRPAAPRSEHTRCTSISGRSQFTRCRVHDASYRVSPPPRPCKVPPCKATANPPPLLLRHKESRIYSLFQLLIDSFSFLLTITITCVCHSLATIPVTPSQLTPLLQIDIFRTPWAGVRMDSEHEVRSRHHPNGNGPSTQQLLSPPRHMSSPLLSSPTRSRRTKERRNPSVTPRRFRKFFTPTAASMRGRRILSSLDETSINRQPLSPSSLRSDVLSSDPVCPSPSQSACENAQKRKRNHDQEGSSDQKDDAPMPPLLLVPGDDGPGLLPAFQSSQGAGFRLQTTEQDRLGDWRKATLVSSWVSPCVCEDLGYADHLLPGPILPS